MPRNANTRWNHELERDVNTGTRTERRCTQCTTWLPETEENFSYGVNRRRYNAWCKPCVRAYRRSDGDGIGRRFGVEIEFIGNSNNLARAMRDAGLECSVQQYNHRVSRSAWKIVPDGSVYNGAELVSPILRGDDGFAQLVKASVALNAAGCTVNKSTGLHVHHDVRDLTVSAFKRLVRNWHDCQAGTDALVAPSRRRGQNNFCPWLDDYDLARVDAMTSMTRTYARSMLRANRYRTLNVMSYPKYGTVEVRQHQGSTDDKKIAAWVRFGQAMVEAAVAGQALTADDAHDLVDALVTLPAETALYLHQRANKLGLARQYAAV